MILKISKDDKRPDCICWCQVRPIACSLFCCGCVVHTDHVEQEPG